MREIFEQERRKDTRKRSGREEEKRRNYSLDRERALGGRPRGVAAKKENECVRGQRKGLKGVK